VDACSCPERAHSRVSPSAIFPSNPQPPTPQLYTEIYHGNSLSPGSFAVNALPHGDHLSVNTRRTAFSPPTPAAANSGPLLQPVSVSSPLYRIMRKGSGGSAGPYDLTDSDFLPRSPLSCSSCASPDNLNPPHLRALAEVEVEAEDDEAAA